MSSSEARSHILIENAKDFESLMQTSKSYSFFAAKVLDRTVGQCDIIGSFNITEKIKLGLCKQTILFENIGFYADVSFASKSDSKVIFNNCTFNQAEYEGELSPLYGFWVESSNTVYVDGEKVSK